MILSLSSKKKVTESRNSNFPKYYISMSKIAVIKSVIKTYIHLLLTYNTICMMALNLHEFMRKYYNYPHFRFEETKVSQF